MIYGFYFLQIDSIYSIHSNCVTCLASANINNNCNNNLPSKILNHAIIIFTVQRDDLGALWVATIFQEQIVLFSFIFAIDRNALPSVPFNIELCPTSSWSRVTMAVISPFILFHKYALYASELFCLSRKNASVMFFST